MNETTDWPDAEYPHKELTGKIIAAAIAVHEELGPGFIEDVYESAMMIELARRGLSVERQTEFPVFYCGQQVGLHRADLIVEKLVVVELKAVAALIPIHYAQTKSTAQAAGLEIGLLINFNVTRLRDGIKRVICSKRR